MKQKTELKDRYRDEKGRLYFYDNAKFLLILLVVLGHAVSPFKSAHFGIYVFWKVANTIHMPLMIFISGFFAKRYIGKNGSLKVQRTFSYFALFLFCQLAVSLFEVFVLGNKIGGSVIAARSSLWFLQCLGIWYLVLPFFSKFKPAVVMVSALILGLLIGYDSRAEVVFSISRIIVHFPFFMAGYFCTPEMIEKLNHIGVRIACLILFAGGVYLIIYMFDDYPGNLITCTYPYKTFSETVSLPYGLVWMLRLLFYSLAVILGISFLAIVPRIKTFFTRFGSRTLQVYILHRFLYLCWLDKNLMWWKLFDNTENGLLYVFLIGTALTIILSLKIFSYPFTAIQNIPIGKLLAKEREETVK